MCLQTWTTAGLAVDATSTSSSDSLPQTGFSAHLRDLLHTMDVGYAGCRAAAWADVRRWVAWCGPVDSFNGHRVAFFNGAAGLPAVSLKRWRNPSPRAVMARSPMAAALTPRWLAQYRGPTWCARVTGHYGTAPWTRTIIRHSMPD
jgi:hypothetical protein